MKKILTLSLLFAVFDTFAQKRALLLNLKKDSTYYFNTTATLTITEDIPGLKQVITTIINSSIAHKVTIIGDTSYTLEVAYKSMGMHMGLPGGKSVNFNTITAGSNDLLSK